MYVLITMRVEVAYRQQVTTLYFHDLHSIKGSFIGTAGETEPSDEMDKSLPYSPPQCKKISVIYQTHQLLFFVVAPLALCHRDEQRPLVGPGTCFFFHV